MAVILETSLGDLTVDLMIEDRPRTCLNFLKLCKLKYFNMCLFHTVQRNLVAQSGDPDPKGNGLGGASIYKHLYGDQAAYFEPETKPRIKHTRKGLVSMVNDGNNMHGSQFFVSLADDLNYLDQQGHTVFGEVSEGDEVLDKINEIYCDSKNKPYQNIRILHTVILDDPYDDPSGLQFPDDSPKPDIKDYENGRLEFDEDLDPFKDKTEEEIQRIFAEKEAKANAQILEMIGDLPDQDVAPEDNVLFVCKLNPVTTDDDLEIIFSRFGAIKSCEVIRDSKTEESLQYAFIEFEKNEYCENAYFKMDNVLIDDRRIHVDFSQSVAKVKWKGKGKGVQQFDAKKNEGTKPPKYTGGLYGLNLDSGTAKKQSKGDKVKSRGRKDRSRSQSLEGKRKSRSQSRERTRRSPDRSGVRRHSRSKDRKRRSRSKDRGQRSRSKDRGQRSRSKDRGQRSRSKDKRQRSRSKDRRQRSRSKDKRQRSRSKDKRQRSRSKDRRRRSRSRSNDRHKSSRSRAGYRSRSEEKTGRNRSRSKDRDSRHKRI